jgi:hypothetical protein
VTVTGKSQLVEPNMTTAQITERIRAALRSGDGAARQMFDRVRATDPAQAQRVADDLAGGAR